MASQEIHSSCGQPWAIHKGASRLGACPGGRLTAAGVPITKQETATFAQLQASNELGAWLDPALDVVAQVVWAALYPPRPADDEAEASIEQRLAAVVASVDEFKEQLVVKVAEAIGKRAPVRKTRHDAPAWSGIL